MQPTLCVLLIGLLTLVNTSSGFDRDKDDHHSVKRLLKANRHKNRTNQADAVKKLIHRVIGDSHSLDDFIIEIDSHRGDDLLDSFEARIESTYITQPLYNTHNVVYSS